MASPVRLTNSLGDISSTNPLPIEGSITSTAGASEVSQYIFHDLDESGNPITYIGKEKNDGNWLVQEMDETSGLVMRYANISNNATRTTYSAAWSNRATLSYALLENLTSV